MPEWTPEQKRAIDSRDGTVLVSAAAGSGKTAVLVERVVQRLADETRPCSVNNLLIVTFTRAATRQMKERISQALSDRLAADPTNRHLKKQLMMLPLAHIVTIDSFCGELVRNNFQDADKAPDYRMLSEAELKIMRLDAIDRVLDEKYAEKSEGFLRLTGLLTRGADDTELSDLIMDVYENSTAFARPDKWLDSLLAPYNGTSLPLRETPWGRLICEEAKLAVDHCISMCDRIQRCIGRDSEAAALYGDYLAEISSGLANLNTSLEADSWDDIREKFLHFALGRLPKQNGKEYCVSVIDLKDRIKKIICEKTAALFCASEAENAEDMDYLRPAAQSLIDCVRRFGEIFAENKRRADGADFADITHTALKLLITYDEDGNPVKTALAEDISRSFEEILIDEHQDTNEIQNVLFSAISRDDTNVFMVGDAKQSIYRFRQAMPEIFISRRDGMEEYVDGNYPAKITLGRNFRSRRGVTENINFIFSQLMSSEMGEIEYDDEEKLIPAAEYTREADFPEAELHIVSGSEEAPKVSRQREALYVAGMISGIIADKMQVRDKDGFRDIRYGDICILLRSTAGGKAEIYANALAEYNVPAFIMGSTGFFDAPEISTVISLLRVIDNPIQDIPLLAVMLSPIYGFTPDELAKIRIPDRKKPFYHCVVDSAASGDEKSIGFMRAVENLRMLASTMPCDEFLRELYDTTGYISVCAAMSDGSNRRANLNKLIEYAGDYEQTGRRGISGFIRFIDRVRRNNSDFDNTADISESANTVRIMTIHKSKGLEFPVCILADTSSRFFNEYGSKSYSFHTRGGICFDMINNEKRLKYPTVGKKAIAAADRRSSLSEELRILYVALTRAKERLICVARFDSPQKKIRELELELGNRTAAPVYTVSHCNSPAEWLLLALCRHPDMRATTGKLSYLAPELLNISERLNVVFAEEVDSPAAETVTDRKSELDTRLLEEIGARLAYEYPYASLCGIRAKSAPSEFDNTGFSTEHFAAAKPAFLSRTGLNPASRGTATHKFMQFYDYSENAGTIDEQAQRMVSQRRLTPDEAAALDKGKLAAFFAGELAQRIRRSGSVMREKRFTVGIPAGELYRGLPENVRDETIVIQGYIDCVFEEDGKLVIVDYKTDRRADMATLLERYSTQLALYRRALAECTGMEVKETLLYSFENNASAALEKI